MRKCYREVRIIIAFLIALILIGLGVGFVSSLGGGMKCDLLECLCPEDGEIKCNYCNQNDAVFMLGIINVYYECSTYETVTCKDGIKIDKRPETDDNCGYKWYLYWIKLN